MIYESVIITARNHNVTFGHYTIIFVNVYGYRY